MAYEYKCGTCANFKDKNETYKPFDIRWAEKEKGYCDWYRCFYWADDSCTTHYKKTTPFRSPDTACYITTVVCEILQYPDDCELLNTMRRFRNNILQPNEDYKQMLYEYDVIGPQIAQNLKKDYEEDQDIELATIIFNFYIQPTAKFINDKEYDNAIRRYQEMTNALKEMYHIEPLDKIDKDYDQKQGGHGIVYKKGSINLN